LCRRLGFLLLLCGGLLTIQVRGQTASAPSPSTQNSLAAAKSAADQLVDQLVQNVERYRATLPSLTAHESIVSKFDEVVFFGRSVYKAEATVRMVRKSADEPLKESRLYTAFNGKPIAPGQQPRLPITLGDDFSDIPSDFFSTSNRHCYEFTLSPHPKDAPLELLISPNPDAATLPQCISAPKGRTGMVRVDPATLQLTHLESTTPMPNAEPNHSPAFISADYAPAKVGDKIFWLPATVIFRVVIGKDPMEWISHYSDYHQFTATATILPTTPE
jgi:hypothetical protein